MPEEFTTEELATEEWRDVLQSPSYQVSNIGRIRRTVPTPWIKREVPYLLKRCPNSHGYYTHVLCENGIRQKGVALHSLIALAFIGSRPFKFDVNHIDGNKRNNRVLNLEYCSELENTRHAIRTGLTQTKGQGNGRAKLTDDNVREIRCLIAAGVANWHIAPLFKVSNALIGLIKNGRNWTHVR